MLLSYLKLASLNLSCCKVVAKVKILKFGTKNVWFAKITGIWKKYYHIWNQHPRICLNGKFRKKMKTPKFGARKGLSGYLWAEIWKYYFHIWNMRPRICLVAKFGAKIKILKFGTKSIYLIWVFFGWNLKNFLSY